MNRTELVARAKAILAEAYEEAAEMIVLYLEDHPSEQIKPLCREIDPDNWGALEHRVRRAKDRKAASGAESSAPAPRWIEGRGARAAKQALTEDPESVIAALPPEQVENLIKTANQVAVERARAQRAEHQTTTKAPTAGDLMGGEKFDASESWADTLIIRANRNLRELDSHTGRWGLVLGSMPIEEAFEYAQETERLAAEFRAAVQERLRDHAEVQR